MHFSILPFAIVALAAEPSVPSLTIKLILLEIAYILFFEFSPAHVLKYKVGIFGERNSLDFFGRTLPREFVLELISDYLLEFSFAFDE